ncbi:hypothetical protein PGUG_00609 [Meyerozyma guilliermondii ATCC 6260]|uniref:Nucleolar protein 9 n=1 Tax=Meyerozyma guilliermondii (strain ATCC 6260 / CBS 566 / DSM 6381 / JCM 1539 / NBRC 10279 / NRRL Y-324) TaxID=294746 RepID=NOP9_PICGU|nr:uncharacterized protein PGUG_00609 [Meyerozyma guilliermondii ATCC 6260]A5DBF4.2 RecName: Full=Nucleolar protein 9; AltName: Full=Pumilio domain-containing protein NOP9 [Meyerozyma guilliermondii ATCC 6260]EDK36511.2 hypothetical protein PGUG_00609 [Meyerozyma guilliermondii ATCC 6260]
MSQPRCFMQDLIVSSSPENFSITSMGPKVRGRRAPNRETREAKRQEDLVEDEQISEPTSNLTTPFFGLVDASEIEYFKSAESTLNVTSFESTEERDAFINSVLDEASGKELKLVTNQICSKLMERIILFGGDQQLISIFKSFSNHFVSLAHHKYSSHVLETLLVRIAGLVEKELARSAEDAADQEVTVEHLFITMMQEFYPHINEMITHQYASHVLRLLILILASKKLPSALTANSTLRSKKSKIARKMIEIKDNEDFDRSFETPPSFKDELKKVCKCISENKTMKEMRELSIHKIASPVIQLVIQVEGLVDKERSVWHLVFLPESNSEDPQEEAFVEHLLSDSVGSHFFESIIKNGGARPKYIERLYKLYMKDRIMKLARRSTTGVYIVQALMFKLRPNEVEFILDEVIPELSNLVSIVDNQNIDLGRSVIDASISRSNYRRDDIISQLLSKFAPNFNPKNPSQNDNYDLLENTLLLSSSTLGNTRDDWPTAEERRNALFLEKLLDYDTSFLLAVWTSFLAMPKERFLQMCFHGVFSHVVEHALAVIPASIGESKEVNILRKRLLNVFQGSIVSLACNAYGSHIVDKLWSFTVLMKMYKERFATEMKAESHKVKESTYGRLVWKNWSMELFLRKKYDWSQLIKVQDEEYHNEGAEAETERVKRPIELKMEQLAKKNEKSSLDSTNNDERNKRQRIR